MLTLNRKGQCMTFTELVNKFYTIFSAKLFQIGPNNVTLSSIIVFAIILVIFIVSSRFLSYRVLDRVLLKMQIVEGTRYIIRRIVEYSLIIVGAIVAFQTIGINLSGLAVVFGLLSVGIGFGLQNVVSNFIAGLILLFERPISVGDRVTVGDTEGDVMEIKIRATIIRSLNNISIIVPNSEFISGRVTNWSHGDPKVRLEIDVGVSYSSDLNIVLDSLKEVALENPEVLRAPEPEVHLKSFGDSSWNMHLRLWITNPKRHPYVRSDINCAIVRKFRQNDIEIPFPQRDLHMRSSIPVPVVTENNNSQRE